MILSSLGVFGWREQDENLALASLLTGDPLLLIGNAGCAKTHAATKLAQALGRRFLAYDASKCMFEDILGYPHVEKLKKGIVEYISSPVTIWDKEFILIDELNRTEPSMQSKWLEAIRSRKIMGFPTDVKWIWSAMNPMGYAGTQTLDDALIGRFALFLYPPEVLSMTESDRISVLTHINGSDAPSLSEWTHGATAGTVSEDDLHLTGKRLNQILYTAGRYFLSLREQMSTLPEFLAKFADLLVRETRGEVTLDGRRLGFIYRNLLANRAIELAKSEILGDSVPEFISSARYVIQSSIPVGLNDQGINREEAAHKMEICFDLLSRYFDDKAELTTVNLIYELFTNPDLMRKAELLLTVDLGEFALSKAWTDLMKEDRDLTLLAYTALNVEARRPGTVPAELLAGLSRKIEPSRLTPGCIPNLKNEAIEYVDEVEELLQQPSDLAKLVAISRVKSLVEKGVVNSRTIRETQRAIQNDIATFEALLTRTPDKTRRGEAA